MTIPGLPEVDFGAGQPAEGAADVTPTALLLQIGNPPGSGDSDGPGDNENNGTGHANGRHADGNGNGDAHGASHHKYHGKRTGIAKPR